MLVSLALSIPALADELPAVYELARGVGTANHEHHLDLARAALRLGDREAAIGHVSRGLYYSGRYFGLAKSAKAAKQLHDREELASLRGDPAFEQLFVDDAAQRETALAAEAAAQAKQAAKAKGKPKPKPKQAKPRKPGTTAAPRRQSEHRAGTRR